MRHTPAQDMPKQCCGCRKSLIASKRHRIEDSLEMRFRLNLGKGGHITVSAAWCGGCARDGVARFIAEWDRKLLGPKP